MSDPSKAAIEREIESKRRKLEELKRMRAQRLQQQSIDETASQRLSTTALAGQGASALSPQSGKAQSAEDILSSVSSLISTAPSAAPKVPVAGAAAASPSATGVGAAGSARPSPKLSASTPTHVDIAAGDAKILYEQATQTELKRKQAEAEAAAAVAASEVGGTASASTGTSTAPTTDSIWDSIDSDERDEIIHERDDLRAREVTLLSRIRELTLQGETRAAAAEAAAEKAMHAELPAEEAERVLASDEFGSFLERSSKIMERLLGYEGSARGSGGSQGAALVHSALGSFDYMADYGAADEAADGKGGAGRAAQLTPSHVFANEGAAGGSSFARTAGRPVTAVNWSPKYPELLLASYGASHSSMEEGSATDGLSMDPDGSVLVWNLHMAKRPEYAFNCQSGIHTALFHPAHPKLIVGGCENGQLVIWDMRTNKSTPVNRSSLSHGHTHPVFALDIQPLASGLYQIVSCSSDGQVCVWTENNLHRPLHDVQLTNMRPGMGGAAAGAGGLDGSSGGVGVGVGSSREELTTTCFDLPSRDTNTLLLGSDEGRIYKARLHEAAPADRVYDVIHAHDAPMTSLQFHPSYKSSAAAGATAANDLFLTSSYDWTVKLWSNKLSKPLFVFEAARDYVHAAAWCPSNPYIFAAGDGTGKLDVWSLGQDAAAGDDVDVPLLSVQVGAPAEVDAAGVPLPASSPNAAGAAGSGADAAADLTTALRPNHAISALKWNHTGSMIACGVSSGALHLYDVSSDVYTPTREATDRFYAKISNRITAPR